MGQAVAERLLADHDVSIWNRTPHKADLLVERGAREVTDRCEALRATEVAIASLANDEAVREVAYDKDGIIECLVDGIYIEASTISPALSGELAARSPRFVAMPIVGSPLAMRSGNARLLVGGDQSVIETIAPILASLSSSVIRYRTAPQASVAKLANNLMLLVGVIALSEAVVVGRAGGLTNEETHDLFADSPVVAPGVASRLDAVLNDTDEVLWTVDLGAKDLRLALDLAVTDSANLAIAEAAYARYREASDRGFGDEDIAAVARLARP